MIIAVQNTNMQDCHLKETVDLLQWMCIPFAMLNEHVGSMSTDIVDWVGRVDPSEYAFYVDYGLLLIFGGIPWQVSQKLSSRTKCANEPKKFMNLAVPLLFVLNSYQNYIIKNISSVA